MPNYRTAVSGNRITRGLNSRFESGGRILLDPFENIAERCRVHHKSQVYDQNGVFYAPRHEIYPRCETGPPLNVLPVQTLATEGDDRVCPLAQTHVVELELATGEEWWQLSARLGPLPEVAEFTAK